MKNGHVIPEAGRKKGRKPGQNMDKYTKQELVKDLTSGMSVREAARKYTMATSNVYTLKRSMLR